MFTNEQIAHDLAVAYTMQVASHNGGSHEELIRVYKSQYERFLKELQKNN